MDIVDQICEEAVPTDNNGTIPKEAQPVIKTITIRVEEWKLGGAFATANYVHGGADIAMQCVLLHLMMTGMMVYSSGGSKGAPVIHLGPVAIGGELEKYEELFEIYGKRFAEQTAAI